MNATASIPALPYNTAVRAERKAGRTSLDFLPTQPWGVRAFVEQALGGDLAGARVLEPANGGGDLSRTLREFGASVTTADIADYGLAEPVLQADFRTWSEEPGQFDLVMTNPPFNQAAAFVQKGLKIADGVAVLVRHGFLETIGRYEALFRRDPPDEIWVYVERLPLLTGRLDPKKGSATCYCWLLWRRGGDRQARTRWIEPCRKRLERPEDYHGLSWKWEGLLGRPRPDIPLALVATLDLGTITGEDDLAAAGARIPPALQLLRPAEGVHLHRRPRRTVASLLETTPAGVRRVLARVSVRQEASAAPAVDQLLARLGEWDRGEGGGRVSTAPLRSLRSTHPSPSPPSLSGGRMMG